MNNILALVKMILKFFIPICKKSSSKLGIKETSEALVALNEIGLDMSKRLQDGVDAGDFALFWQNLHTDVEFKNKLKAGFDSYGKVPAEFKDLDTGEAMELGLVQIDFIPKFVEAFKKKDA